MLKQFVVVIAVLLFAVAGAYGNTVGVTYSEVLGDRSAGCLLYTSPSPRDS